VIRLTKEEKAARYDALQTAIRFTAKGYRTQRQECMTRYAAYGADTNILAAYNKGMADALGAVVEMLERWSDG